MAAPSEMSKAALDAKVLEITTHMEAGEWQAALDDLDIADALMVFTPDLEFDNQRKEYRQKAEQLQNLRRSVERRIARDTTTGRGKLTHIPVVRKLDSA